MEIRNFEQYVFHNGISIVEFFLSIEKEKQRKRLQFLQIISDKVLNRIFKFAVNLN